MRAGLAGRVAEPSPWEVPGARNAAVLAPLFEVEGELRVLLTRRAATLRSHQGEIAFPGGRQEPGEDLVTAALREAHEEIGLHPSAVDVIGQLDHLSTYVSRFAIAPYVGALDGRPATTPNPAEIARVFDVTIAELLEPGVHRQELWPLPDGDRVLSFFELEGETVWGATARMLTQLLTLVTQPPQLP
jgi:8-oxo-dGTP pyrophosphatase MutT (NUDIX family)